MLAVLYLWIVFCCNHFDRCFCFIAACITIVANDDAYGVFSFDSLSLVSTITETSGTATDDNGEGAWHGVGMACRHGLHVKHFYTTAAIDNLFSRMHSC